MRKITFLMALLAVFWTNNVFAGVKTSTAWFNNETFDTGFTLGQDLKTSGISPYSGWSTTSGKYVLIQNATSYNYGSASNQFLGYSVGNVNTLSEVGETGSRFFSKSFTNSLSGYIYLKTSFYTATGGNYSPYYGTTYTLKNTSGSDVFVFGGSYATSNALFCTGVNNTSMSLGVRAKWADIECILNTTTSKIIKVTMTYNGTTKVFSNLDLPAGSDVKSIYVYGNRGYVAGGIDNTTIGELEPDNIKDITSSQSNHQTLGNTNVNTTFGVTNFTNQMSSDLPFSGSTLLDIQWSISDWGGMPVEDQSKFTLTRNGSDYTSAIFSSNNSVNADYTVTVQAVHGSTTLTKTLLVKGEDINGIKSTLLSEITSAVNARDAITAANPYIANLKSNLNSAISSAQNIHNNSSSASELSSETSTLQSAVATFNSGMTPYSDFVTYIGTITGTHDAETRTLPYFTTIKSNLNGAISTATGAKEAVETSTDISNAKLALQTANNQFVSDKTTFDNFNTQITSVGSRITAANIRKGDERFLQFPTATVQTLIDAKTTAETSRDNETTAAAMISAQSTLTTALNTFNSASRVAPGSGYYRIYTWGADGGDGGSTKSILFDSNGTLRYKANSTTLDANSIWKITETTTNKYTIQNTKTGNFISGTSVGSSTEFSLNEVKSQTGLVTGPSEIYNLFSIVNSSSKALEVDLYDGVTGVFITSNSAADRYRFAYQFEPIATLPASLSANLSEATNWSSGSAPTTGDIAISGSLTADQDATSLNNVNITSGGQLTVNAGKKLTVTNGVFANNGTFSLASDETNGTATFVNPTLIVNSITATVNQYLTSGRNWYVASPISGATAANLLTGASKVYKYDEPTAAWVELVSTDALEAGKGYLTQANATGNVSFNGTLNDGAITVNLTRTSGANKAGFNLVGNPYPSYVNWDAVTKTNVDPTMYYRTKNGAGTYKFATYSATTQLGTNVNIGLAAEQHPADYVTGNIPPMQAFWVRVLPAVDGSSTTGSIAFANSARAHKGTQTQSGSVINDSKMRAPAAALQQVLRLAVSNGINADEAILLFNNNASDGLDAFDSYKMSNNTASIPEIYTRVNANDLVINGMNSYDYNTIVPLGFKAGETNNYTISASQMYNFDADTKIILKDDLTGIQTDLSAGESYSFSSDAINTTDRFSVLFKSAAGTTDLVNSRNGIKVYAVDNQIFVENQGFSKTTNAEVFNTLGQKMYSQSLNSDVNKINRDFSTGVYFVKINDGKQTAAYKLIIR